MVVQHTVQYYCQKSFIVIIQNNGFPACICGDLNCRISTNVFSEVCELSVLL